MTGKAYDGPERREYPVSWAEIEVGLRHILADELSKLEVRIYERTLTPLIADVKAQSEYCDQHSQRLTAAETKLQDLVDAKLIRRTEVVESRLALVGKATVVTATIAGTAIGGILVMLLTGQLQL